MNQPDNKENAKILVIDDEQGWRDLFAWELSSRGYEFTMAESGFAAVEICKNQTFDLIITDIKMPGMDGVDTFLAIRKVQPHVRIILMTGYAVDDRIQKGLSSKATVCIRKPFEFDLMMETIQQSLSITSGL